MSENPANINATINCKKKTSLDEKQGKLVRKGFRD